MSLADVTDPKPLVLLLLCQVTVVALFLILHLCIKSKLEFNDTVLNNNILRESVPLKKTENWFQSAIRLTNRYSFIGLVRNWLKSSLASSMNL